MPIQYILKVLLPKTENFQLKNSDIFHISAQNIDCGYSLEPPRQVHWLELVDINLYKKNNQNIRKGSWVMVIFTNWQQKRTLTLALPQSMKDGILQFRMFNIVNISVYTSFYQNTPYDSRLTANFIFSQFWSLLASINEKWHLASPLVTTCRKECLVKGLLPFSFFFGIVGLRLAWAMKRAFGKPIDMSL